MLAVIAGRGALPRAVASAAEGPVIVAALAGFDPVGVVPDLYFRLETLGSLPGILHKQGVSEVVLAGGIERPAVDPSLIDAATLPLVPRLMGALQSGDDAALRVVLSIFEEGGLSVVAAQDAAPNLLPPAGVLTQSEPTQAHERDAHRAAGVVQVIGAADIGQGCVVKKGQVLAMEGVFGTDWMLASLASRPDGGGGLFFKAPKPDQDRRVDLPVIGPSTVAAAANAGLSGLIIEAGGVMILDRDETIRQADALGLFLWVRPA